MIGRLRRLFRRDEADPVEDLVSQYVDSESEFDRAHIESNLHGSGIDAEDLQSIREVAEMLRSSDTVEAPRSYALTPETLAARGYSEDEAAKILNPRSGWGGIRLRTTVVYVPLTIAVVALAGVALLTIGDLSEYVTDRFDSGAVEDSPVIAERAAQSSDAPGEPGTPGVPPLVQTVVVEKEVIVLRTVIVEKQVQVAGETVIQTVEVEKVVEKEVVVEVEKLVEVEREMIVEVGVEKEVIREIETLPTPAAARAEMAAEAMTKLEAADDEPDPTPIPTEIPCAILPTATPTGSPVASTTPEPTATMSSIPTCTPTPTPSPTPTATPTPTP